MIYHKKNTNLGDILMRLTKTLLAAAILIITSGCATMMNPFGSEFSCAKTTNGKCISVDDAYQESLENKNDSGGGDTKLNVKESMLTDKELYQNERYRELRNLIKKPKTPMIKPPKVMRILIIPYSVDEDDKYGSELYMPRYIYFIPEKPSWVLGDYLYKDK